MKYYRASLLPRLVLPQHQQHRQQQRQRQHRPVPQLQQLPFQQQQQPQVRPLEMQPNRVLFSLSVHGLHGKRSHIHPDWTCHGFHSGNRYPFRERRWLQRTHAHVRGGSAWRQHNHCLSFIFSTPLGSFQNVSKIYSINGMAFQNGLTVGVVVYCANIGTCTLVLTCNAQGEWTEGATSVVVTEIECIGA